MCSSDLYQISIGGEQGKLGDHAALGKVIGPSFARAEVPGVIEKLIEFYLKNRQSAEERFIEVVQRLGIDPFKKHVYGDTDKKQAHRAKSLAIA